MTGPANRSMIRSVSMSSRISPRGCALEDRSHLGAARFDEVVVEDRVQVWVVGGFPEQPRHQRCGARALRGGAHE